MIAQLDREDPRTFVGYCVGYEGTGIYRVWIPSQNKVIRTRDVFFDEDNYIYDLAKVNTIIIYAEYLKTRLVIKLLPQV